MTNVEVRKHFLQPTWSRGSHLDRFQQIRPYVVGKRVLDLGAGSGSHRTDWFHRMIREVAVEVVGVELSHQLVLNALGQGVDLVEGDAETVRLERTFDVVFAGELIEHLSCFGGLLETALVHLEPGSRLVLTTPNAFAISNFVYRIGGKARVHSEHTCWFCEDTLAALVERHGFEVESIVYLKHTTPGHIRRFAAGAIRWLLPDRLAHNTLMLVARPAVSQPTS